MYTYSTNPIINFAKTNHYLVSKESDKYSAMMNIIKNIPILAKELDSFSQAKLESTKLELKAILSDFKFNLDSFSKDDLELGGKYSNLVFRCNIFNKEHFYIFRNSVYDLASNMYKEEGRNFKDIDDAVDSLLWNFLYNIHEVEMGKESLENLIDTWTPIYN